MVLILVAVIGKMHHEPNSKVPRAPSRRRNADFFLAARRALVHLSGISDRYFLLHRSCNMIKSMIRLRVNGGPKSSKTGTLEILPLGGSAGAVACASKPRLIDRVWVGPPTSCNKDPLAAKVINGFAPPHERVTADSSQVFRRPSIFSKSHKL